MMKNCLRKKNLNFDFLAEIGDEMDWNKPENFQAPRASQIYSFWFYCKCTKLFKAFILQKMKWLNQIMVLEGYGRF